MAETRLAAACGGGGRLTHSTSKPQGCRGKGQATRDSPRAPRAAMAQRARADSPFSQQRGGPETPGPRVPSLRLSQTSSAAEAAPAVAPAPRDLPDLCRPCWGRGRFPGRQLACFLTLSLPTPLSRPGECARRVSGNTVCGTGGRPPRFPLPFLLPLMAPNTAVRDCVLLRLTPIHTVSQSLPGLPAPERCPLEGKGSGCGGHSGKCLTHSMCSGRT